MSSTSEPMAVCRSSPGSTPTRREFRRGTASTNWRDGWIAVAAQRPQQFQALLGVAGVGEADAARGRAVRAARARSMLAALDAAGGPRRARAHRAGERFFRPPRAPCRRGRSRLPPRRDGPDGAGRRLLELRRRAPEPRQGPPGPGPAHRGDPSASSATALPRSRSGWSSGAVAIDGRYAPTSMAG